MLSPGDVEELADFMALISIETIVAIEVLSDYEDEEKLQISNYTLTSYEGRYLRI